VTLYVPDSMLAFSALRNTENGPQFAVCKGSRYIRSTAIEKLGRSGALESNARNWLALYRSVVIVIVIAVLVVLGMVMMTIMMMRCRLVTVLISLRQRTKSSSDPECHKGDKCVFNFHIFSLKGGYRRLENQ
jgi:hypothetical protein